MKAGRNPGDVLATADFRLHGVGYKGVKVDDTVHAELQVSGAFFGNQTCMVFEFSATRGRETYDVRYNKVSPENFTEFAKMVLKDRVMDTITIDVIEKEEKLNGEN